MTRSFALITDYEIGRPSGYGKIIASLGRELVRRGNRVWLYSLNSTDPSLVVNHPEPFAIVPTASDRLRDQLSFLVGQADYVLVGGELPLHQALNTFIQIPYIGLFVIDGDDFQYPTSYSAAIQSIPVAVTLTQHAVSLCQSKGIQASYLPIGIDEHFRPDMTIRLANRKRMGFTPDDLIILTVADNHERKDHPTNMQAFAHFADRYPNAYYILVSRPRPSTIGYDLRALARNLGVLDSTIIYDREAIPEEQLVKLYQMSDTFLLLSAAEGFGVPLLEAMSCGLPCVTSKGSGMEEQVSGIGYVARSSHSYIHPLGNTLRYVTDPEDAAYGLELLTCNPARRAQAIQAGFEHASKLSWAHSVDCLEAILERKETQTQN